MQLYMYLKVALAIYLIATKKLECAVDGAPSQIPTLKSLTPQHPQALPLGHDPSNRMKILFNIFSFIGEKICTKFGIKIYEIDMVTEI